MPSGKLCPETTPATNARRGDACKKKIVEQDFCECEDEELVPVAPDTEAEPGWEWHLRKLQGRVYCGCAGCPGSVRYGWYKRRIV